MSTERRDYQEQAVRRLRCQLKKRRVIAVSPTGSGKTVVAAKLVKAERKWRVLFLAHTHEIVDQAYDKLREAGVRAGIVMATDERLHGNARVDPKARVQVASVQTVDRRGVPDCDLIVFDEAHRTMADMYQRIAAARPKAMVLGLTATPCRLDGQGLGGFYAEMYEVAKPSELQSQGHLAKPRVYTAPPDALAEIIRGLSEAVVSDGDFTASSAGRAVDRSVLIGHVVKEAMRLCPGAPKLVFACNVAHSKRLAARFRRAGVKAEHIDASTPADERVRILAALRSGEIEVICNVDILGEGWDMPALGAVIVARPTRSIARFLQMAGRCTRPYKGRVPLVIDHGANVQRLGIIPGMDIAWSLDGAPKRGGDPVVKVCKECLACIPAGCIECPHCGAETPIEKTKRQMLEDERILLVEVKEEQMRQLRETCAVVAAGKPVVAEWLVKALAR